MVSYEIFENAWGFEQTLINTIGDYLCGYIQDYLTQKSIDLAYEYYSIHTRDCFSQLILSQKKKYVFKDNSCTKIEYYLPETNILCRFIS